MKVVLYIGPMFSGKTTRLISELEKHILSGRKCIVIKHKIDTRHNDELKTHGGIPLKGCDIISTNSISGTIKKINDQQISIIGIDEGQFFTKNDMLEFIMAVPAASKIYVTGLNGDFMKRPFSTISAIIPYATTVHVLTSICHNCGKKAIFSKRIVDSKSKILIGGDDKYKPSCWGCFD